MFPLKAFDPSSFWMILPPLTKLYVIFLCCVCAFSLYKSARIMLRLRSIKRGQGDRHGVMGSLAVLRTQATNLSQLFHFTFLLFGLCFLIQIPVAFMIGDDSGRSVLGSIFRNLAVYIAYAADVFFVMLLLRSVQWFVSFRINAAMMRFGDLDADGR